MINQWVKIVPPETFSEGVKTVGSKAFCAFAAKQSAAFVLIPKKE